MEQDYYFLLKEARKGKKFQTHLKNWLAMTKLDKLTETERISTDDGGEQTKVTLKLIVDNNIFSYTSHTCISKGRTINEMIIRSRFFGKELPPTSSNANGPAAGRRMKRRFKRPYMLLVQLIVVMALFNFLYCMPKNVIGEGKISITSTGQQQGGANSDKSSSLSSKSNGLSNTIDKKDQIEDEEVMQEDTKESKNRAPIIIAAGRGATGTHTMTKAMCLLGVPSIHYNVGCIPSNEILSGADVVKDGKLENINVIPEKYLNLFRIAEQIRLDVNSVARCISLDDCQKDISAIRLREKLIENIDRLVNCTMSITLESAEKLSFHDFPYPSLMPTLIRKVKKYYNGSMPVLVLTDREPVEYVMKRIEHNQHVHDIICKDNSTILPQTLKRGAFDIVGCINRYLSNLPPKKAKKSATIKQVFTTLHQIHNDSEKKGVENYITKQVGEYNAALRSLADFSINLFEQEVQITEETLAKKIIASIDTFSPEKEGTCSYVNFWRRSRIANEHFKV